MTRSVTLDARQRQALLDRYRKDPDPEVRFRSHILLLLDDGHTWATVAALLFCSSRTIDRWVKRFHAEGVEGLAGHKPGRPFRFAADWVAVVVEWVTKHRPRATSASSAAAGAARPSPSLMLRDSTTSRSAARPSAAGCIAGDLVYRRPRPALGPTDARAAGQAGRAPRAPGRAARRRDGRLPGRGRHQHQPQDRLDVDGQGPAGRRSRRRGTTRSGTSPGRSTGGPARSSSPRAQPKQGRDTALFLAHLDDLRRRLRRYRKIHVICDNAKCHTSDEVAVYLWEHRDRIELHFLPAYSPDCNPIERVWWNLHEQITRNHQCKSMEELLDLTFAWLGEPEPVQGRRPLGLQARRLRHFPC